jgi:hypothetical protein
LLSVRILIGGLAALPPAPSVIETSTSAEGGVTCPSRNTPGRPSIWANAPGQLSNYNDKSITIIIIIIITFNNPEKIVLMT